ncbi:MAG: ABC transporter permease, partial [Thermomicrobiales bacterium]|nr:ABC transporter permease [Thermomicrobiales bacterium]
MTSTDPAIDRRTLIPTLTPRVRLPSPPLGRLAGAIVPLALLALWQLVVSAEIYSRSQLPAPLDVVAALRELFALDLLWPNIGPSLWRVAVGFAAGALVAVVAGLAVGLSRRVETLVAPTFQAIRAVPSLAWVPLLILWLGIGEGPKLTLIAIGGFFPVYTALVAGIRQIDRKLVEAGRAYGLSGAALAREVLLPAALPSLFTGLRLGLAQAWLFLVAAELIGASAGLGFLLTDAQNTGRADIIMLSIVLLATIGKSADWLLALAEGRLLRWADT